MSDYNLDTANDGSYKPVTVTYRGEEYHLGAGALGVIRAPSIIGGEKVLTGEMILTKLPELLKELGPDLHKAIEADPEPLGVSEELMLIEAITEVLKRFGKFRSSPDEDEE